MNGCETQSTCLQYALYLSLHCVYCRCHDTAKHAKYLLRKKNWKWLPGGNQYGGTDPQHPIFVLIKLFPQHNC